MINVDVLYLSKNNRSTKIIYSNKIEYSNLTINNLIDNELEKSLANLESRLFTTKRALNITKFVPIYFNQGVILQPINPLDYWDLTLINVCQILSYQELNNQVLITFKNKSQLIVDVSYRRFTRYLDNCYKIKTMQYALEKESIEYGKENN